MSMVWCKNCKTVVWAFDHTSDDVRGIMNLLQLVCPNCGSRRTFDGISSTDWEEMKQCARERQLDWKPSGDNTLYPADFLDRYVDWLSSL